MTIKYHQKRDTLEIILGADSVETFEDETGDFSVSIDDTETVTKVTIKRASHFFKQASSAGVQLEKGAAKPVWEDVDSSMISAFKYDETAEILEVMFHRTGVYRYFDVPADVVEGLRASSSKGSYTRSMIIDMYAYEKR